MSTSNEIKNSLASGVIATDTTTYGSAILLPVYTTGLIVQSTVSSRTDGTYTSRLQHSLDNSVWYDVYDHSTAATHVCAAQAANGTVQKSLSLISPVMQYVRTATLSAGTTTGATVATKIIYSSSKV